MHLLRRATAATGVIPRAPLPREHLSSRRRNTHKHAHTHARRRRRRRETSGRQQASLRLKASTGPKRPDAFREISGGHTQAPASTRSCVARQLTRFASLGLPGLVASREITREWTWHSQTLAGQEVTRQ
ncbi:unnamed protein product [Pleuronectes platessa]|uniref:Uncharacterized protein n=1 Tax=Pleuronectes platessa TaxID=8262 RepID=A0A9N7VG17_PLEPL|nr:unnamed protein product [Pleuronectes platessa]